LAKTIKANDLGKFAQRAPNPEAKVKDKVLRKETNPDDEPWAERIHSKRDAAGDTKRVLAELSD
jgi:hypothetical protein